MAAVHQDGEALQFASATLRNGDLRAHVKEQLLTHITMTLANLGFVLAMRPLNLLLRFAGMPSEGQLVQLRALRHLDFDAAEEAADATPTQPAGAVAITLFKPAAGEDPDRNPYIVDHHIPLPRPARGW